MEAERKLEELTKEIEEELAKKEEQGGYFGRLIFSNFVAMTTIFYLKFNVRTGICRACGEKVTGLGGQACQVRGFYTKKLSWQPINFFK